MKHSVAAITMMLLLCNLCAQAAGYRLDVGHFDPQGALTQGSNHETGLPDGCLGQVIEDLGDNGIALPALNGSPGEGNAMLQDGSGGAPFTFAINGTARFNVAGDFLIAPGFSAEQLPPHRIFLRVWNAGTPEQASGYWDSPLYTVLPGVQQVSFLRSEWCWSAFTPARKPDAALAEAHTLNAYPNPFNASTRISFVLEQSEHVKLSVYDLQARLVSTMVDAPMASGRHDLMFDGSALPSGLYFLRIQAGKELTQVRRLLLIR